MLDFWLLAVCLLSVVRLIVRAGRRLLWPRRRKARRVVIVGTGARARAMAETLIERHELGYQLVGFVDDIDDAGVIGPLDRLPEILAANVVDEIIVALPVKTFYEEIGRLVRVAADQGITVRLHSDLFSVGRARAVAEQLDQTPIISLYTGPRWSLGFLLKQVIDFVGAALLLALSAPLLLAISLAIKLTSPGPAVFVQERLGYNKRPFRMYKFRTMVADAERQQARLEHLNEAQGPVFKMRADPRVTPLGRLLRQTSLDELPQLFNVLKGDLSLVGPRLLPRRDFERFDEYWFNRRFSVKPGLTCIWQVSGRSGASFEQWIQQDLEYIDRWSLALDLWILWKTIPAVLRGTGAM